MLAAAGVTAAGAGAVAAVYKTFSGAGPSPAADDEDDEVIVVDDKGEKTSTWKDSSGRDWGGDSYVFGDLTRGAVVKMFGKKTTKEMEEIEAAGDEQHSQVQRLVLEAVRLFRARGYNGTVNFSHTIAHFTESASVKVDGPAIGEPAPWELADAAATPTSRQDAKAKAMTEAVAAAKQVAEDGRSGMVFTTLLMRLERRAKSWQSLSGAEGLDPSLSSSAHIGFAMPVIKVGWGVSVSLTVSTSTLLRWAEHAEQMEAEEREAKDQ